MIKETKAQYIIGIITTKNRFQLLSRAVSSAISQTRKPDRLIICSDSNESECIDKERLLAVKHGIFYISNNHTRNCSGVRNCAVLSYIKNNLVDIHKFDSHYIAFLDDDDFWHETYVEKCYNNIINEPDFIVSGLIFQDGDSEKKLSIPQNLDVSSFLQSNQHIQGSNIFIKLTSLLKCGLFDENMSSTVDRDLFVRLMFLNPNYVIINEHLVYADVDNSRWRITNSIELKKKDLKTFFLKYSGIMSADTKSAFFERIKRLFNIDIHDILENPKQEIHNQQKQETLRTVNKYDGRLVVGIIITNIDLGIRLINEFVSLENTKIKFVIVKNFEGESKPIIDILQNAKCEYKILDNCRTIREICTNRNILYDNLYLETVKNDVIWVLDDDMELSYISENGTFQHCDIHSVITKYMNLYDAIVGDYTMDPPLPPLSTLRTKLLDFVYTTKLGYNGGIVLNSMTDYYYDLSERTSEHLETPFLVLNHKTTLEDIFSGKATSRPLTLTMHEDRSELNCGGNVLIFNRELLKISHATISVGNYVGRRSDYFWTMECVRRGYTIANVAFATLHNRKVSLFEYDKESNKLLRDIIGASCMKTIKKIGIASPSNDLANLFLETVNHRLTKYIASYYRIIGLLKMIGNNKYENIFTELTLIDFVFEVQNIMHNNNIDEEWNILFNKLNQSYANE